MIFNSSDEDVKRDAVMFLGGKTSIQLPIKGGKLGKCSGDCRLVSAVRIDESHFNTLRSLQVSSFYCNTRITINFQTIPFWMVDLQVSTNAYVIFMVYHFVRTGLLQAENLSRMK